MPTKDEIARKLIDWHFEVEPEITEVYRFIAPDEENDSEPIKLLEVSEATLTAGYVMPFGFGATEEFPYRSVVALITPEEMQQIKNQEMPLPQGWNLSAVRVFAAPSKEKGKMAQVKGERAFASCPLQPAQVVRPLPPQIRLSLAEAYASQSQSDFKVYEKFLQDAEENVTVFTFCKWLARKLPKRIVSGILLIFQKKTCTVMFSSPSLS